MDIVVDVYIFMAQYILLSHMAIKEYRLLISKKLAPDGSPSSVTDGHDLTVYRMIPGPVVLFHDKKVCTV